MATIGELSGLAPVHTTDEVISAKIGAAHDYLTTAYNRMSVCITEFNCREMEMHVQACMEVLDILHGQIQMIPIIIKAEHLHQKKSALKVIFGLKHEVMTKIEAAELTIKSLPKVAQ